MVIDVRLEVPKRVGTNVVGTGTIHLKFPFTRQPLYVEDRANIDLSLDDQEAQNLCNWLGRLGFIPEK